MGFFIFDLIVLIVLILAVVQGYTVRETAEILGAPQGTVSSKLHRTLKKLRAQLER